ncbi:family 78 glycoside hydrolase catalytic domain [Lactobacillus sp. ESL0791]|uniref:alpha-L-rhamnosidase n=1 Tax=Lactobacillus sp. ESL0791 TaxID=2983234 RepID=UPI0023F693E4|nr:alpha-L-rhamnosidase [Lactobacillus sp. ESL0791]MDF7638723.1 family 78 glycoside hydrolase catalytic domain [Lactobacillus sp. ESL0791]
MKILQITVNHMQEPIGFAFGNRIYLEFSAQTSAKIAEVKKRVIISAESKLYDSGWQDYIDNSFDVKLKLVPRTHYTVTVFLKNNFEKTQKSTFFETGKMNEHYTAKWIGNSDKSLQNTLLRKKFRLTKAVTNARLYITGLGLYEVYFNQKKVGSEFLTPGITAYDQLTQVQTYDISKMFSNELEQELLISLGDGWYKGTFGFDGGQNNIYGSRQMAIAELHLTFTDGSKRIINSDSSWQTTSGKITKSAIYYGEDYNAAIKIHDWQPATIINHELTALHDRLSLPLKIHEYLPVKDIIHTPKGETVLDFGQNHAGWPEFYNRAASKSTVKLEMGEILQDGNFYQKNLRHARAAFEYTSNGKKEWIRPHFTYYGYRYVKITGFAQTPKKKDFRSAVIYSDLKTTGNIETDNALVNRLLKNIIWSQKSNFFDVPTDCPQRDERLGWTGDAEIFSNTALLNMNCYAFFKKYAKDMLIEQKQHKGMLTMYAPAMGNDAGGTAIWGDAATIIPWHAYQATGDPAILRQNYSAMKAWVDWITNTTNTNNLWTGSFQFGDWLSLDGENPAIPTGKTDEDFIASIFYYYSSLIVGQTGQLLGNAHDAQKYFAQAQRIKKAVQDEYITPNGRLAIDTQTAYALVLYFDLVPASQKKHVINGLLKRLNKDNNHLKTGFVGTPLVCQVLSANGHHKLATQIFLNEDYPSWLYAVKLGATTVWERWNSVLPDGKMNPEGMNSLNHYSIGAIMEWVYKYVLGLNRTTFDYQKVTFKPNFDFRLKHVSGSYESSYGKLQFAYQLEADQLHTIKIKAIIPFGQIVNVILPRSQNANITINGKTTSGKIILTNGNYDICYQPDKSYIEYYDIEMPVKNLMIDKELVKELMPINTVFSFLQKEKNLENFDSMNLSTLNDSLPFINISKQEFKKISGILNKTPLMSERRFIHERRTV